MTLASSLPFQGILGLKFDDTPVSRACGLRCHRAGVEGLLWHLRSALS